MIVRESAETASAELEKPSCTRPEARSDRIVALVLCLVLVALYSANGEVLPGKDAAPNVYLAAELLDEGRISFTPSRVPWLFTWERRTTNGDRFVRVFDMAERIDGAEASSLYAGGLLVPHPPYYLTRSVRIEPTLTGSVEVDRSNAEPVYVGVFGPGAGLSAVPVLAPLRAVVGPLGEHPALLWFGAKLAASLYAAASASLVFLTSRRWLARWPAVFLALAYGVGTSVWSTSSQTLWQHGSNEFFLALGIYALARGGRPLVAVAGAAFAAATTCRPTSAVFVVAAAAWLLVVNRRALVAFVGGSIPITLALAAYNAYYLGSSLVFGQAVVGPAIALAKTGSPDIWQTSLWVGLAGLLVSPSRGLFVFSPWLVLAVAGAVVAWRRTEYGPLRPLTIAAAAVIAVQAKFFDWWGGWAFGYRPIVDLAPVLAALAIPVVGWALATRRRATAMAVLTGWSVFVQALGALAYDVEGWNARHVTRISKPSGEIVNLEAPASEAAIALGGRVLDERWKDIDRAANRDRLWSLVDNQIGYYLCRFPQAFEQKAARSRQWVASWRRSVPN
jgi:hypothetical protein